MKKIIFVLAIALFALLGVEAQRSIETTEWTKTLQNNVTYTLKPDGENVVLKEGENDLKSFTQPLTITFKKIYSPTIDEGVIINGVKWSTRNVDAFGTFAATPEASGMLYQWNRRKGWPAASVTTGWDNSTPTGTSWTTTNDPSPAGWRIPTREELQTLLDTEKVTNEWVIQNGVNGIEFTDVLTHNTLFLPVVGYLSNYFGTLTDAGIDGLYWSNTASGTDDAFSLRLGYGSPTEFNGSRRAGQSVRSVAK